MKIKLQTLSAFIIGAIIFTGIGMYAFNGGSPKVVVEGDYIEAENSVIQLEQEEELELGKVIYDRYNFSGDVFSEATFTVQEYSLGSRYSADLDLTSTSTKPGNAAILENTKGDMICSRVDLDITTGSTTGGRAGAGSPFNISVGTTSDLFVGNGTSLIATTTIATTTSPLLDSINDKGTYASTAGQSFEWNLSDYIQVSFDEITTDNASSTSLTGMAGKIYVHCIKR